MYKSLKLKENVDFLFWRMMAITGKQGKILNDMEEKIMSSALADAEEEEILPKLKYSFKKMFIEGNRKTEATNSMFTRGRSSDRRSYSDRDQRNNSYKKSWDTRSGSYGKNNGRYRSQSNGRFRSQSNGKRSYSKEGDKTNEFKILDFTKHPNYISNKVVENEGITPFTIDAGSPFHSLTTGANVRQR